MPAELHVMRQTNLQDVPATLRNIAEGIENGEYGEVLGCVVVLDAKELGVHYMGTGEAAPNTALLLHAAIGKMVAGVLEAKT